MQIVKLALFIGTLIEYGLVLNVLWGWFVTPLGVPPLGSVWHALGVVLTVSLFSSSTMRAVQTVQDSFDYLLKESRPAEYAHVKRVREIGGYVVAFLLPIILLCFGAIYRYLWVGSL